MGILFHLAYSAKNGNKLSQWMLGAFGIVVLGVLNDVLYVSGSFGLGISPTLRLSHLFWHKVDFGANSANAFRQAEHLGEHLQEEVDVATRSLKQQNDESMFYGAKLRCRLSLCKHLIGRRLNSFKMSHELRTPLTLLLNPLEYALELILTIAI